MSLFALLLFGQLFPPIVFPAPPPLIVVEPGIQIVEDYGEDVFVVDGVYWHRRGDGRWYKAPDYRGAWVLVDVKVVPPTIVKVTPGKYKHWKGPKKDKEEKHEDKGDKGKGHGKKK